jgi:hypothetical protein
MQMRREFISTEIKKKGGGGGAFSLFLAYICMYVRDLMISSSTKLVVINKKGEN